MRNKKRIYVPFMEIKFTKIVKIHNIKRKLP